MASKSESITVPSRSKRLVLLLWLPLYLMVTLITTAMPVAMPYDHSHSLNVHSDVSFTADNDQDKIPVHIPAGPASATSQKDLSENGNLGKTLDDGMIALPLDFSIYQNLLFPQSEVIHFSIKLLNKEQISLIILFQSWKIFLA